MTKLLSLLGPILPICALSAPALAQNVSTYHNDLARDGMYVAPNLTPASAATLHKDPKFVGKISGIMRSQLLYWTNPNTGIGEIIVTTNENNVAALNATTGAVIWQQNLGPIPAPAGGKCSSGLTTGILGTPVIDSNAGILYLSSFMLPQGQANNTGAPGVHYVWALSLIDGTPITQIGGNPVTNPVDVAAGLANLGMTFNPAREGERSALALVNGQLFVPYGSNTGECSDFHGWVVQVNPTSGSVVAGWETSALKGGIWSQGGVVSDGTSMFVATGNTGGTQVWHDGEAVVRLNAGLVHSTNTQDYFAPANWHELDQNDLDLGSSNPVPINVPIPGGGTAQWLFQIGKDGTAYILDRNNLGGLGGGLLRQQVAVAEVATAPAVYTAPDGSGVFVSMIANATSCPTPVGGTGLVTLKIQATPTPAITTAWCQAIAAQGAPVVTTTDGLNHPIVWVEGAIGDGEVHGFDGVTGAVLFAGGTSADHLGGTRRWDALIWVNSGFYIAGTNHVYRFAYTPNL